MHRRGFTITEALVAIVLTALVLSAAIPLVSSTARKLYRARDHYVATMLALAHLERLRDVPYDQLPRVLTSEEHVRINDQGAPDQEGRFRRTTTALPDHPETGVTMVTVTVEIMDRKTGRFEGEQETMSYLFTEYLKPLE